MRPHLGQVERVETPFLRIREAHYLNVPVKEITVKCVSRIWASLTWLKFVICRLEPISTTAPAASKNVACLKSGQN